MARVYQELEQALPGLVKAVYSQPAEPLAAPKVTVRPLVIKGRACYQIETFKDSKAYHKNVEAEELLLLAEKELEGRYRQVLLVGGRESAQYVLRQRGDYKKSSSSPSLPRRGEGRATTAPRNISCGRGRISRPWWTWAYSPRTLRSFAPAMTNISR